MSPSDATLPNEDDIGGWRFWYDLLSFRFCVNHIYLGYHTVTLISMSIYMPSFSYDLDLTHETKCMLPRR